MIEMAASVGQDFSRSKEQLTDGDGDGDEDDGEEILDPRVKVEKGYRTDNNSWSFRIKKLGLLLQWRRFRYIFAFWIAFIIESIFFHHSGRTRPAELLNRRDQSFGTRPRGIRIAYSSC